MSYNGGIEIKIDLFPFASSRGNPRSGLKSDAMRQSTDAVSRCDCKCLALLTLMRGDRRVSLEAALAKDAARVEWLWAGGK